MNEAGLYVGGVENLDVGDGRNFIDLFEAGGIFGGSLGNGQGVTIGRDLNIHSGSGSDMVDAYSLTVGGTLNVSDSGGTNTFDFSLAQIRLTANFTVAGGTNYIYLGQNSVLGAVPTTRFMVGGSLNIVATSGTTHIVESLTHVGLSENIILSSGDDSVAITTTTVVGSMYADGAGGYNTLALGPGNSFGHATFKHFNLIY